MNNFLEYLQFSNTTNILLIIIGFISAFYTYSKYPQDQGTNKVTTILIVLFLIWRIGLQPIGLGTYNDRDIYAINFYGIKDGLQQPGSDLLFYYITLILSNWVNIEIYFFIIGLIYVLLYAKSCVNLESKYSCWLLIGIAISFGFISYGINTMRAGLAISFLVLGLTYYNKIWRLIFLLIVGVGIHFSMIIPALMIIVSRFYDKTSLYLKLWFLSIPVSLIAGNYFNVIFAGFGDDARTSYLTTTETAYNIGFRYDFLLYSLAPVIIGYFYIYKYNFQSSIYKIFFNSYLLTNIFWILVIRANFSDRIAYLSWFLIPFVLLYPILKQPDIVKSPNVWLSAIILGETCFKLII